MILASTALSLGCGDDDSPKKPANTGGSSTGAAGSGGKAGSPGTAGKGGAGTAPSKPSTTAKGTAKKSSAASKPTAGTTTKKTTTKTGTASVSKSPDTDNPCADTALEGIGACVGDGDMAFCSEGELWLASCTGVVQAAFPNTGYDTGVCYETDDAIDCLGCATIEGVPYCCTGDAAGVEDICCDDQGNCYTAASE